MPPRPPGQVTDARQRARQMMDTIDFEVRDSEQFTTSAAQQKAIDDTTVKFCEVLYPEYCVTHGEEAGDALDLSDVPALVTRLKAFLSYLRGTADGLEGEGVPSVKTMNGYVWQIQQMVKRKVEQSTDAAGVEAEKTRVFKYSGDGQDGVEVAVRRHAEYLCKRHSLPSEVFDRDPYGRNEALMLLSLMRGHITDGRCDDVSPVTSILETMLLVQLAFLTGLRSLSLLDSDSGRNEGIRLGSIRIEQRPRHYYTLHFTVTHLEGHNSSPLHPIDRPVRISAVTLIDNAALDPIPSLVSLLILHGVLVEEGGANISTVQAFWDSPAANFVVSQASREAPLFRTYNEGHSGALDDDRATEEAGQPLEVRGAAGRLRLWTQLACLPQASLHPFRFDFAQQVETQMGGDFATRALDFQGKRDAFLEQYTGGIALYNVSALRLGEKSASTNVSHLSQYKRSASVGVRALALRRKEAGPSPASALTVYELQDAEEAILVSNNDFVRSLRDAQTRASWMTGRVLNAEARGAPEIAYAQITLMEHYLQANEDQLRD